MTTHDALLARLTALRPLLVEQARGVGIPTTIVADSLDLDDAEIAMKRMERFADAVAASPDAWTPFGAGIVVTSERGSSVAADGSRLEVRRPARTASDARQNAMRAALTTTMTLPEGRGSVGVHVCEILRAVDVHQDPPSDDPTAMDGPAQALAAVLTVHAAADARRNAILSADESGIRHPSGMDPAWETLKHLVNLLETGTSDRLHVQVSPSTGSTLPRLNIGLIPNGRTVKLDEATHRAVTSRIGSMLRLVVAGPDQNTRDALKMVPTAPASRYKLKALHMSASLKDVAHDPMSIMRAMNHLGLDAMPVLTKEDRG